MNLRKKIHQKNKPSDCLTDKQLLAYRNLLQVLKSMRVLGDFYINTRSYMDTVETTKRIKTGIRSESEWKKFYSIEGLIVSQERILDGTDFRMSITC